MNINETTKIVFTNEDGEQETFFVEEQTRVNGVDYLLVSDSLDDEAQAYILKDMSADGDDTAAYVMVDDDVEFDAIADVFRQMIEDVDLE